jgi:anion-transporting  ArsA/GET3 family ATPase
MSDRLASLLGRRLLIVTGKGGTGKTTLAAALARLAARRGLSTLAVEVGRAPALPRLLWSAGGPPPEDDGRIPAPMGPGLATLRIVPETALVEYLELQLPLRAGLATVLGSSGLRRLLDAAPGWRELITLGKIWHLTSLTDDTRPRYDLVVVDAPATGHGLSLLSVPDVVVDTVRLGPLRRHTEHVRDLIHDSDQTLVLPITLAEELPVRETLELRQRLGELGVGLGPVFANRLEPSIPRAATLLAALRDLPADTDLSPLPAPANLAEIISHAARRQSLQGEFLDELATGIAGAADEAIVELPLAPEGIDDAHECAEFSEVLEAAMAETPTA